MIFLKICYQHGNEIVHCERIETVIGQLTERFHIQKVRARDSWHLCNRLNRKILAHLVCSFINTRLSRPPIQFDGLVQI
jgi:hypothetical protein